jgi:hypothetical protein
MQSQRGVRRAPAGRFARGRGQLGDLPAAPKVRRMPLPLPDGQPAVRCAELKTALRYGCWRVLAAGAWIPAAKDWGPISLVRSSLCGGQLAALADAATARNNTAAKNILFFPNLSF